MVQWRMIDAYDLVPYTEHAYAESHPDHLQVIAALSGFTGPSSLTPRVLELGCGRGGNLLALAASWPEASFVGVDRSPAQVRDATRIATAALLSNVSFVVADFTREPSTETFDFVLCHGVYSWIPVGDRPALLDRIRAALAPQGIAYVSFNTLPGWYRRLAARDFLRFAARASFAGGPRDALLWLGKAVSPELAPYRGDLLAVHERLLATDAAYLTHEYLAEEHHPVHVATFLEECALADLAYLGDAIPSETALELLPDAVRARADPLDTSAALTLADFTRDTAFRRALLVRSDTARASSFGAPRALDPRAVVAMRASSRLCPLGDAGGSGGSGAETFEGAGTRVVLEGAPRAALHALAKVAPRSISCVELAHAIGASPARVASELFELWIAGAGVDLHLREPELVSTVSRRPRASPVARWHAIEGGPVTNAWHQEVLLPDTVVRFVLGRLDGETTTEMLARAVRERAREGERVSEVEALSLVEASLAILEKAGLLVG